MGAITASTLIAVTAASAAISGGISYLTRPKPLEPPPVKPPPPMEGPDDEDVESRKRRLAKAGSRSRSIITGDLTPDTGKKTLLGG